MTKGKVSPLAEPFPQGAEVAVVGAGLAGAVAALLLARGGVRVVVLERGRPGEGETGRSLGLLTPGLNESLDRVAEVLGASRALALWDFTSASLSFLGSLIAEEKVDCQLRSPGSLTLALSEAEARSLDDSFALLEGNRTAGELWDAGTVESRTGGVGFARGWFRPEGGTLDPRALVEGLLQGAERRGARILTGVEVLGVEEESAGGRLWIHSNFGKFPAEMAMLTASALSPSLGPWLGDKMFPVRAQMQALEAVTGAPLPWPVIARRGYESWRQEPSGELLFEGCRWAEQPEMECGITEDGSLSEKIHQAQRGFLARHLPHFKEAGTLQRWTGIMAFTADGLPIVGPLPGNRRLISCGGWNGKALTLAPLSACLCVEGILGTLGDTPLPEGFAPSRLL